MREYKTKMRGQKKSVNFHSKLVAKDRWSKNLEHKKVTNIDIFNKGYEWFESGLSLEDASDEIKNDFNFVNGFEKAKRVQKINESLEMLGVEWFNSGLPLEKAPDNYINSPYFINGFNTAMNNANKRSL